MDLSDLACCVLDQLEPARPAGFRLELHSLSRVPAHEVAEAWAEQRGRALVYVVQQGEKRYIAQSGVALKSLLRWLGMHHGVDTLITSDGHDNRETVFLRERNWTRCGDCPLAEQRLSETVALLGVLGVGAASVLKQTAS